MEAADLAVLGTAAFLTSALTAIAGLGGGVVLIAILLLYFEPVVAIPLHGAMQLVSNAFRTTLQRHHVDGAIVGRYALLLVPGSALGLALLDAIPASAGRVVIGAFVLLATWWPRGLLLGLHPDRLDPRRRFLGLGAAAGVANMTFGAAGPLLGPFFRDIGLSRQGVVGTFAACQTLGHAVKVVLFAIAGFAFGAHATLLALMMGAVVAGTTVGTRLLERVSEPAFHELYRVMLTLVALRLVGAELWRWLS